MKFRYLTYAGAALMLLASCETRKEQIYYESDVDAVQISATVGCIHSKSNPLGVSEELRTFNFNDVICVQTPDLVAEYYKTSTGWEPTDRYYFRWNTDPVTFQAYYPVVGGAGYDKFAVRPNQYSHENLVASDYMTGEAVGVFREKVNIVMHRKMAKLSFKLTGVEEGMKVQAFKIGSYSVYEAGEPSGNTTISPYVATPDIPAGADGTEYTAIVIPGPVSSKAAFVTMTYKGSNLKVTGIPEFEAGYSYDYTITFNGKTMTLSEPVVSCWTEAVASDNVPEGPDSPTEPDTPTEPEEPDTPTEPEEPTEPEVPEVPVLENAYFVTPEGAGDKSGSSWENAMGLAELRPMLGVDYGSKTVEDCAALDGHTFYFKEGSYCMTTNEKDRMKLSFPNYAKPCRITFLGGYDESSTGIDLTKRDINANVTKFTGDRNGNGKADAGDAGIFCLDAYAYLTIDGCTFAHSSGLATWKQKAFMMNTDVAGATTELSLSNCKFTDIQDFKDSNAKYHGGAAIWLCKGATAKLTDCEITGLTSSSRGGAIRLVEATSVMYMNNCSVYGNKISDVWGNGIQVSNGNIYINNSTIAKNTGAGGAFNGGGNQLIVNTTIVNSHVSGEPARDMTLRNESMAESNTAVLLNSIVLFEGDKPSIVIASGDNRAMTSKGYNLYGTLCTDASVSPGTFNTNATDKSSMTVSGLGMSWDSAGYYKWNGVVDGFTNAKLSDVENIVKDVDSAFYNWLQEVGAGKNPLAHDQLGNARSTTAMWPGAYEKH